jgi:alkylation response protein AidB-like acyl-CoA dehydrogenase
VPGQPPELEDYRRRAAGWLAGQLPVRAAPSATGSGGTPGHHDLAIFHDLTPEAERRLLDQLMAFQQAKYDAGYAAITWPRADGGAGLTADHERAYLEAEAAFATPESHEVFSITVNLVAPTVRLFGTADQKARFVRRFVRADELCCQLFSEPGAGSDLASLATRAVADGDGWVLNGQKVWTSGARFAAWGELVARTDPDRPKHEGMTAFLVPMDAPGVEVRPIRQMSGGASFNEVFFTDVRLGDELRLGPVGDGWKVALATLGFERGNARGTRKVGGSFDQLVELTRAKGRTGDPLVRQRLAEVYIGARIVAFIAQRIAEAAAAGQPPGPEGSIRKLAWVGQLTRIAEAAAMVAGADLTADAGPARGGVTGYAWTAHVLGAPGYHVAGGSDEIQRNIIGERVLGLAADPRVDRGVPWSETRR